jgi:rod shape-determining protein MreD
LLEHSYDLPAVFVLYLGLFRHVRESIAVILLLGFVMDSLSGGPFGLYLTTYLWLFIGVRWVIKYLHAGNRILLPFVVASGILIENLIFLGTAVSLDPGAHFSATALNTLAFQVVFAAFSGPFLLLFFSHTHRKWDRWVREFSSD